MNASRALAGPNQMCPDAMDPDSSTAVMSLGSASVEALVQRARELGLPLVRLGEATLAAVVSRDLRERDLHLRLSGTRSLVLEVPGEMTVSELATRLARPAAPETLSEPAPPISLFFADSDQAALEQVPVPGTELAITATLTGDNALRLQAHYATRRYEAWVVECILEHARRALVAVAHAPDLRVADLPLLTDAERRTLLVDWNDTRVGWRTDACIHQLFEDQVAARPDAPAVKFQDRMLTYAELDARANQLARRLQSLGVGPDAPVGVWLERTPELIVSLLGILKAGGGYVPLDPSYPRERLAFMLDDARVRVVVTNQHWAGSLPEGGATLLLLDQQAESLAREDPRPLHVPLTADNLAYVNYTSGSTGLPKGVEVVHRAVNRLVCKVDYVELDAHKTVLHASTLAFDASTFEIWGALLNGGCCALHDEQVPTAGGLGASIRRYGVTTMWLTAGLFNAVVDDAPEQLRGVRQVLVGGEAPSPEHIRRAQAALPEAEFINGYGPTECTTFACCYRMPSPLDAAWRSIPTGRPIRDTRVYVLDERLEPAPLGAVGELFIGGDGLARGYLHRPELTAERFIPDPFGAAGERLYRTGDLVRWAPDGTIRFVGRADGQVKIRGFRIEVGEIRSVLAQHPAIRDCAVVAREDTPGGKRLVAYLVAAEAAAPVATDSLRDFLRAHLPEYMLPTYFVWLAALPVTANGKLDRAALPRPTSRPELSSDYVAPSSPLERQLATIWSDLLGVADVGVDDQFFDLGGDSLRVLRLAARLRQDLGLEVPIVHLFQHTTIRELAASLTGQTAASRPAPAEPQPAGRGAIAIVGMAGRFPAAASIEAFWQNLCNGIEGITFFKDSDLDPAVGPTTRRDPSYVKARGILTDVEQFDAGFFGINPKEAMIMDPQQRVLLEVAWEALERAGHVPETFGGPIGVFAGKYNNSYYALNVLSRPDLIEQVGAFNVMLANEKDYIATRVAHKLDLTGPALSIHTACSTSLVAVCQAVESLRRGECDLALAGGVSITVPVRSGYVYQEGAMLSSDGHTRPFDAQAQGTTFSDGVAVVVLRRLEDALADGDTIYAVIRGVAVNNDGAHKASFTAPSVKGQSAVIARAQADAAVDPRSISYVETHGTATPLGDPIEIEALTQAFRARTSDVGFCAIGSAKSNVGHLVIAAGATGFIKTALAMHTGIIPPSINYHRPNPAIDFSATPFYVADRALDWPTGQAPRRAGVSSFGVGGTNAHVVLEEAPARTSAAANREEQLLVLSARTPAALEAASTRLADHLRSHPELDLADVAFTLQTGRGVFSNRRVVVARATQDAIDGLTGTTSRGQRHDHQAKTQPSVVFMFPGQGSQYPGMTRELYEREPVFRAAVDHCATVLQPHLGVDIRDHLYPSSDGDDAAAQLRQTSIAQPAIFTVEYALAMLWQSWGIVPATMIGHSVGEFVCAVLADVMTLEDALHLVAARGHLMQAQPSGAMLGISLPAEDVATRLHHRPALAIAAENAPNACVVSGPEDSIEALRAELEADGIAARRLVTSHAFHSPMMDPVIEPFTRLVRQVSLHSPSRPFISTLSGTWITAEEATDPSYWSQHLRLPVRFATGLATLLDSGPRLLLEVGPRSVLTSLARRQATEAAGHVAVASLGDTQDGEVTAVLRAVGAVWLHGIAPDWRALHGHSARQRVVLPTYPFERQRYWIDTPAAVALPQSSSSQSSQPEPPEPVVTARTPSTPPVNQHISALNELIEEVTGVELADTDPNSTFLELGLDSLLLTQVVLQLSKRFGVKLTFRQLLESYPTVQLLAEYLAAQLPAEPTATPVTPSTAVAPATVIAASPLSASLSVAPAQMVREAVPVAVPAPAAATSSGSNLQWVIEQQLKLMAQQLTLLGAAPAAAEAAPTASLPAQPTAAPVLGAGVPQAGTSSSSPTTSGPSAHDAPSAGAVDSSGESGLSKYDVKKAFGAIARIHTVGNDELTPKQQARLDAFTRRYTARTQESKRLTQLNRSHLADPRAVTGFRPLLKELTYQITVDRSSGPRVWDVDGNEYIDVLNGFGSCFFGWQPAFITEAVSAQLARGFEIGPMHPLAGEVARLLCDLTGFDRAGFCNTGSEAVLGAIRIARTVTGRKTIALFSGAYHGINDEVIVRGTRKLKALPAAPGILPETAANVLVLDYGTPESLELLRARADELAGILVEPVQSRRPDFQPRDFLLELRRLTEASGTALIVDEMVTGFRTAPAGAQEHFGFKGDLATYGKIVGGGFPLGVIAGKRAWMDALDGGHWQYGDASTPTAGVTYFAGTFVRHPLALAAARAVLQHLKQAGPSLQRDMTEKTAAFASTLNTFFNEVGAPIEIRHFGSLWKTVYTEEQPHGDLLFLFLRDRGIHILDGFPCFFTTAHSAADIEQVSRAFRESVVEMQEAGFLPEPRRRPSSLDLSQPPVPGARLGRDRDGAPAWFIPNPNDSGKYLKVQC